MLKKYIFFQFHKGRNQFQNKIYYLILTFNIPSVKAIVGFSTDIDVRFDAKNLKKY